MIEPVLVTIPPAGFLIVLFGGGVLFLRKHIEQDGEVPINRALFYASKYAVVAIWGAMILQAWGIGISYPGVPPALRVVALGSWFFGFALLFIGRFEMGSSFRLGSASEPTSLRFGGLFRVSRNPMYVGMYATVIASALYTVNPVIAALGAFVIAVHHSIVLAEENHMAEVFGREYANYRNRVRRYI